MLGRIPTERDHAILARAYDKQFVLYSAHADAAKSLLSVGEAARDESLDSAEHAAMTAVCLAILNLDEALTRE